MPLNYTTLQALVLDQAKRADLTTQVVDFIRQAEGLIRREVRAQETRVTLAEADRASDGIYNLPGTIQEVRSIFVPNGDASYPLENVGLHGIRMISPSADVLFYAVTGDTIEFRGVPETDFELDLVGFGWPAELSVTSTNDLLSYHEALYVYGALHYLHLYTQDLELAAAAAQTFTGEAIKLNAFIGRKVGGGSVLPAYNFGHITTGRGY